MIRVGLSAAILTAAIGSAVAAETPQQQEVLRKAGAVYLAVQECATFKNDPVYLDNQTKASTNVLGRSGLFPTIPDIMQASSKVRGLYGAGTVKSEVTGQAACDMADEALKAAP